jgi:septal ring factor EnvC (AmiA/AmiB activator)
LTFVERRFNYFDMDELALNFASVRESTKKVMAQFLRTELAAASILCTLAKVNHRSASADERLRMTRIALDAVRKFMWSVELEPEELDQLTAQLELLKFELESAQRELTAVDGGGAQLREELPAMRKKARPSLAIHLD